MRGIEQGMMLQWGMLVHIGERGGERESVSEASLSDQESVAGSSLSGTEKLEVSSKLVRAGTNGGVPKKK